MIRSLTSDVQIHADVHGYSVDIFIPQWKVAIEYQGDQHYKAVYKGDFVRCVGWFLMSESTRAFRQRIRDERKKMELEQHGITLIHIPYWWNGTWPQLHATLRKNLPGWISPSNLCQHLFYDLFFLIHCSTCTAFGLSSYSNNIASLAKIEWMHIFIIDLLE